MDTVFKLRIQLLVSCTISLLLLLSNMHGRQIEQILLLGSTPGDLPLKKMLNLPIEKEIDFIKWNLLLKESTDGTKKFEMQLHYGVSQPNTSGFTRESAASKAFSGSYTLEKVVTGKITGQILQLFCDSWKDPMRLVKMNDNVYHIVNHDERLMVGNGGWSYSLHRQNPVRETGLDFPSFTNAAGNLSDTSQMVFVGRTPCQDFAGEYSVNVSQECFKLKWKLILKKDPSTGAPANFWMRNVIYGKVAEVEGNWKIIKGNAADPDLIFIQLNPGNPNAMTFLLEDQTVLFPLRKNGKLFEGNADFGYALNLNK